MEDMTAVSPAPREPVGSRAQLAAALLALIGRARHELRFAAADLSILALDQPPLVEALRRMLLARPRNTVRLLVDDMRWLDSGAPRLRALQRTFPHALLLRCAGVQDPVGPEVVALGDDGDALRLLPTAALRGELRCGDPAFARPLRADFDRRWEHASHDQPVKPLGL